MKTIRMRSNITLGFVILFYLNAHVRRSLWPCIGIERQTNLCVFLLFSRCLLYTSWRLCASLWWPYRVVAADALIFRSWSVCVLPPCGTLRAKTKQVTNSQRQAPIAYDTGRKASSADPVMLWEPF